MAPYQTGAVAAWWATNSAVLAVLAALIFAEQSLPAGRRSGQLAAAVPLVDGVVVPRAPAALPLALCGVPCVAGAATSGATAARGRHEQETMMDRIDDRLRALGLTLPTVPTPIANYVPAKRLGSLVTTAGQVSVVGGREYKGQLGAEVGVDAGREATRACAINCLAALLTVLDSLDRVRQVVSVHGFVNSAPGFDGQAAAMNGASDLMVAVFGDAGRHTRTAVGVAGLPFNYTASVYILVEAD